MFKKTKLAGWLSAGFIAMALHANAQDFQVSGPADMGVNTIEIAQEQSSPLVAASTLSAEDQAMNYVIEKFGREGWDPEKKRMVVVHAESWNTEDPAYDKDFASKRALYSTISAMGARAKISEFMGLEMSAQDLLNSPPNDVFSKLNEEYNEANLDFERQKNRVSKLLSQYNEQEAKALDGANWSEKGKSLLDAMIKKLDEDYDVSKLDEKSRARFEDTKKEYAQAVVKLQEIESKAKQSKGSIASTASSTVKTISQGALIGATVIATTESYNPTEEKYEVASVVVWSPKLKASALAMLSGQIESLPAKPGRTLQAWLKKQDMGSLIGPRQIIDENGNRWFIGVYAQDYRGTASAKRAAKGRAEIFAKKEAALAIFADMETVKSAAIAANTVSVDVNTDRTDIATTFAESTSQSLQNITLSGGSSIMRKQTVHPITNSPIYVSVFAISAGAAAEAIKMGKDNYVAAMKIKDYQASLLSDKNNWGAIGIGVSTQTSLNDTQIDKPKSKAASIINADDFDDDAF
jgi:hypothetical protein